MTNRQWNAKELIKLSGSVWQACTLQNAVELDVFTILSTKPLTCEETAKKLNVTTEGLRRLLNALTAMNLLTKTGDRYSVTEESRTLLSKNSEQYIGFLISHHHHLSNNWSRMDEAIASGKPFRTSVEEIDEKHIESFLMGMNTSASFNAPAIVDKIDLSDNRRFLDLGGGPGTYAIHFCKQFPQLKAAVFDLPSSRNFAEKNIKQAGYADRIDFIDGNFNSDDFPGSFDVIWMSHILHGEGEEACRNIIAKASKALEPGGKIIIHEFILDNEGTSPIFPALFSINMFLHTEKGKSYTEAELTDMLTASGMKDVQRINVQTPTDSGLICGVKPGA
jgi:SAM-dependent methyltransferase